MDTLSYHSLYLCREDKYSKGRGTAAAAAASAGRNYCSSSLLQKDALD